MSLVEGITFKRKFCEESTHNVCMHTYYYTTICEEKERIDRERFGVGVVGGADDDLQEIRLRMNSE